jgi:hypothetical protein
MYLILVIWYVDKTEGQSANAKTDLNQRTTYPIGEEASPQVRLMATDDIQFPLLCCHRELLGSRHYKEV